jgi:hypothetical protein
MRFVIKPSDFAVVCSMFYHIFRSLHRSGIRDGIPNLICKCFWRQRAAESLPELGQEIRRLANQAYHTAPNDVKETLAKEQFIDALVSSDMRLRIKQARPTNVNDAVMSSLSTTKACYTCSVVRLIWRSFISMFSFTVRVLSILRWLKGVNKLASEAGVVIRAKVNGVNANMLIHTGATVTLISNDLFERKWNYVQFFFQEMSSLSTTKAFYTCSVVRLIWRSFISLLSSTVKSFEHP